MPELPKTGSIGANIDSPAVDLAALNSLFSTPTYYRRGLHELLGTCCEERQALDLAPDEPNYPLVYACPSGPALIALAGMLLERPLHYEAGMGRADHTASVLWHLRQAKPSSVFYAHTDDEKQDCGCAGIELGRAMLEFLLVHPNLLPETQLRTLIQSIEKVLASNYFGDPGSVVLEKLWQQNLALQRTVTGKHPAQVLVLNHRPLLLDRNRARDAYPKISLLTIDLSAIEPTALVAVDDAHDAILLKQLVRALIEAFICLACSERLLVADLF